MKADTVTSKAGRAPRARGRGLWIVQALVLLLTAGGRAVAATPAEREFYDLRAQRDKAVEQAMKPINDRYQTSLTLLGKRATQAGDLDTALLIRNELEQLAGKGPAAGAKAGDRASDFTGTTWEWHVGSDDIDIFRGTLTLEKGGKVKVPASLDTIKSWEPVDDRRFKIINAAGSFWVFEFTPAKQLARAVFEKGALHEDRFLKLVPAIK